MTVNVSGILFDEFGAPLDNMTCVVVAIDGVIGQDGGGRVEVGQTVLTDGSGVFDADIKPGRYVLYVNPTASGGSTQTVRRQGTLVVLTGVTTMTLQAALDSDVGDITPSILQQAEDAATLAQSAYQGRQYELRSAFVTDVSGGYVPTAGTVCAADGLLYVFDSGTEITDLPGWSPVGVYQPGHFGYSSRVLYVNPTGSDANHGFTTGAAKATIQGAINWIRDFEPYNYQWTVNLAAGTYTEEIDMLGINSDDSRIIIQGPASVHPAIPTAIINAPTASGTGFQLSPGVRVRMEGVLFTGFTNGQAININGGSLSTINVHSDGGSVVNLHGGFFGPKGGIFDGTGTSGKIGYAAYYNATHDAAGHSSVAEGTIFRNWATGMQIGEGSQGHLDYITVEDCTTGVDFKRGAGACNTKNMVIQRNGVGIVATCSSWYDNGITFGTGADANTVNVRASGSASEFNIAANARWKQWMVYAEDAIIPQVAITGTSVAQTVYTGPTIPDWAISESGDQFEFAALLTIIAASSFSLRFSMNNGTNNEFAKILGLPNTITRANLTVRGSLNNSADMRGYVSLVDQDGNPYLSYGTSNINFKNTTSNFLLKMTGTAGDLFAGYSVRYSTTAVT